MPPHKTNPKAVFKLDSPYTSPTWPSIAEPNQELFTQLLLSLLSPIARFRSTHVHSSKGRRSKKKRRRIDTAANPPAATQNLDGTRDDADQISELRPPSISKHITIGLNSTVRHLESLASPLFPHASTSATQKSASKASELGNRGQVHALPHLAVIFILQSCSELARAHLPVLARAASVAHSALPPVILVPLCATTQTELARALHQPRVGMLGIMEDAPNASTLLNLVRETVPPVQVPWLDEAITGEYLSTKWHNEVDTLKEA